MSLNARLAEHFISFFTVNLIHSIIQDSIYHMLLKIF